MQLEMAAEIPNGIAVREEVSSARSDDLALAQACARGDASAFERLYRQYGDRMKSIAYNHLGNRDDAEDAVQEAFVKVHRAAETYDGRSSLATWMTRILVNTCYDALRRKQVRPHETELEDLAGAPQEGTKTSDDVLKLTLRTMLEKLAPPRKSVFLLYEVEGLSHREIAAALGIQENYSKWLLFMAKQDLRKLWTSAH